MKKLLSLVLVLSMVLGSVAFAFATPADVVGTDCEEAVTRLEALDILTGYEDGSFKPENNITRAEYAAVVVRALGLDAAAIKGETSFTDVASDHWASGYINIASGLEIVNGYGNAMFGPEDEVTYEQAVTMAVRALGYEPKAADMGGYPNGYLSVAAQEDITDGVAGVVGTAASRCVVAQIIDNSLEVNMMERTGYGDDENYEVGDETLLADKLDATELDTYRVTEVPLSDSDLDSNEITLYKDDEDMDSDEEDLSGTYEMLTVADANSYYGLEVTAWANDDDEIFYMTVETDEDDIIYDTVTYANDDYVTLLVEDDDFDFVSNANLNVNFDMDNEDLAEGDYGRFVMDGDEVVFASVFNFETEDAVVTDVDSDEVTYVTEFDDDILELDNYDDAYYFTAEMMGAEAGDVEDYNAIAYYENDDDEVIVMFEDTMVEGELEAVKTLDVKVDGSWYDVADGAFYSTDELDDLEDVDALTDAIDELDDFMDEDVFMILDFNGDVVAMVADVEGLGDTVYGIVTWAELGSDAEMTVFNGAGEEVDYDFETRSDFDNQLLNSNMYYYDTDNAAFKIGAVEFKLNSDGEVADEEFADFDPVVYATLDDEFTKDEDSNRVYINEDAEDEVYYYIDSDTVFMDAMDDGDLDPALVDYDDVYESGVDGSDNVYAIVIGDEDGAADMVVFVDSFTGSDDDVYYAIAVDGYYEVSDDYYAELDVYDGEKDDYLLADVTTEGAIFAYTINSDNEVVDEGYTVESVYNIDVDDADDADYDDGYVTYGSDTIRVADDVVIYTADDTNEPDGSDFAIDTKVSASKLDDYENVMYIVNDDGEMVVALLWNGVVDDDDDDVDESLVQFVSVDETSIMVNDTVYTADEDTIVKDGTVSPATVEGIGVTAFTAIDKGDSVTIDGDVYTITQYK